MDEVQSSNMDAGMDGSTIKELFSWLVNIRSIKYLLKKINTAFLCYMHFINSYFR
jgi:hypothetical protein